MKKILCILLVVALLAAVMCVPAFAANESDADEGYLLYNGVKLPDYRDFYNEVVVGEGLQLPYQFIYSYEGEYRLVLSPVPVVAATGPFYESIVTFILFLEEAYTFDLRLSSDGSYWEWYDSVEHPVNDVYDTVESMDGFVWSNFDVVEQADSSVYFAATTPEPISESNPLTDDIFPAVDDTLDTGLSMVGTVAKTVVQQPLLLICFTVGFVGIGVALFKRIRK